ncbi:MAG: polyprenyl synthetase family protein [Candidatus Omnitrophica bacterium]|nr:polyprenyl synthetase family protein [Candidatus Omnitrophota bacterium]
MKFEDFFKEDLGKINSALRRFLPRIDLYPQSLHEAMHYSVLIGGKRFRPLLTLAVCEALSGDLERALYPACALEFIHCYSLVQDDLPALDNDDMRRGNPTCHKKFGEATALLASDGLLTLAFEILAEVKPAEMAVQLVREISTASGTCGMIGGQAADIDAVTNTPDVAMLDFINIHKTGKLIKASAVSGALAAGGSDTAIACVQRYGEYLGLAFQCVDDLLDGDGYLRHMSARELGENTRLLIAKAKEEARSLGKSSEKLVFLADFLEQRMPDQTHA